MNKSLAEIAQGRLQEAIKNNTPLYLVSAKYIDKNRDLIVRYTGQFITAYPTDPVQLGFLAGDLIVKQIRTQMAHTPKAVLGYLKLLFIQHSYQKYSGSWISLLLVAPDVFFDVLCVYGYKGSEINNTYSAAVWACVLKANAGIINQYSQPAAEHLSTDEVAAYTAGGAAIGTIVPGVGTVVGGAVGGSIAFIKSFFGSDGADNGPTVTWDNGQGYIAQVSKSMADGFMVDYKNGNGGFTPNQINILLQLLYGDGKNGDWPSGMNTGPADFHESEALRKRFKDYVSKGGGDWWKGPNWDGKSNKGAGVLLWQTVLPDVWALFKSQGGGLTPKQYAYAVSHDGTLVGFTGGTSNSLLTTTKKHNWLWRLFHPGKV